MKKGALATMIIGIVLLVLGLGLSLGGAYLAAPHSVMHNYGHGPFVYTMRYTVSTPGAGGAYGEIGHLLFDAGLAMMVIFAVLQVHGRKEDLSEKERKADKADMHRTASEAVDATVHEVDGDRRK